MRRGAAALLCMGCLCLGLTACGSKTTETTAAMGETMVEETTAQENLYDLGIRLLNAGNYEEAILTFQAAIQIEPKRAELYVGLADAYVGCGQYEMAIQTLANAPADVDDAAAIQEKLGEAEDAWYAYQVEAGLINEQGQHLNAYGAVIFEERDDYVPAEEIEPEAAVIFETVFGTALEASRESMVSLMRGYRSSFAGSEGRWDIFDTIWQGYKVSYVFRYDAKYHAASAFLEIRPENGMGYYIQCRVDENDNTLLGVGTSISYTIVTCPCVDWQWNGSYTQEKYSRSAEYPNDASYYRQQEYTTTGQVVDGFFVGEFVTHLVQTSSERGANSIQDTYYTYEDGYMTSRHLVNITEGTEQDLNITEGERTFVTGSYSDDSNYGLEYYLEDIYW